jgi:myosin V
LFRSQGMGEAKSDLEPHVFAIADRSYRQMMSEQRKSQAILISGESGAGKTESTKFVMSYLTTLGAMGVQQEDTGGLSVMERVLQSNPILEAFGNARTLRNDNSSRFGKFIELGFSRAGHLLGAKVQTYLLEKVRLAFHGSGERNYHIFYQLLRGASEEQKAKYHFSEGGTGGLELANFFHYTKQGGAPQLREFSDESGLEYTVKAMRALGWSDETIDGVLGMIAGLLHLGEIKFTTKASASGQDAADVENRDVLEKCAELLGVDAAQMTVALTEKVLVARGQEIRTELTPDRAIDARDALAKTLYGALFLWIVDSVNQSICWENDGDIRSSVGVLDIFGFECFAVNSFEQLCINFTNEALQQQFNKFIFKLEQEEYDAEKIEWAFISFPDNQDCLDQIQQKKIGILSMLDDECRLPKGSDKNWANRMYEQHLPGKEQIVSENTRFSATKIQQAKAIFCVRHFAGVVEYRAETSFMEKNKDEIPLAAQTLFETAPSQLVQNVYAIQKKETEDRSPDADKTGKGSGKSKTVGQQFKDQLHSLIASVEKTDPHYIRCLKPNDAAKPKMLTRKRLTEQLRYGGVLEAVRVARAGYPVRLTHAAFFQRYRMLLPTTPDKVIPWSMEGKDAQSLCVKLLVACLEEGKKQKGLLSSGKLSPDEPGVTRSEKIRRMQNQPIPMSFPQTDVQLGLTKVFMRKPPHDALEAHRVFHQAASATTIQCWLRGLEQRKRFFLLQEAVYVVQRFYRGCKGRERYEKSMHCDQCDKLYFLMYGCQFLGGGHSVGLRPGNCSRIITECRSAEGNTIAPSEVQPVSRHSFVDLLNAVSSQQSEFRLLPECVGVAKVIANCNPRFWRSNVPRACASRRRFERD